MNLEREIQAQERIIRKVMIIGNPLIHLGGSIIGGAYWWFSWKLAVTNMVIMWFLLLYTPLNSAYLLVSLLTSIHVGFLSWKYPWRKLIEKKVIQEFNERKKTLKEKQAQEVEKERKRQEHEKQITEHRQKEREAEIKLRKELFQRFKESAIKKNEYSGMDAICRCGYEWTIRKKRGKPASCPKCHADTVDINWDEEWTKRV